MQPKRFALFSAFTLAILLVSLVSPAIVLADEATPPADPAAEVAPTDEEPADPAPVDPEAALAETGTIPTDEPAPTEAPPTEAAPVEPAPDVEEVLDSLPEETTVVALDAEGEALPLASVEAAQVITSGDPMWCPAGVLPGGVGCTIGFPSFAALITELENFIGSDSGAGTVYVSYDYDATTAGDAGGDIVFDYGANSLTDLVVQGGWNFGLNSVVGTSTIDLGANNTLDFWDWGAFGFPATLTLRDLVIASGGLYIGDIDSTTTANVTLENVTVTNAEEGTYIETDGSVTVTNSSFDDNNITGLDVISSGNITLTGVTANGNDGDGAHLETCGCLAGNVTISDSEFFVNNGIGLAVFSDGNVTIDSVDANGNNGPGIIALSGGDVAMSTIDTFGNASAGIIVASNGNVALTNLNSGYNGDIGVGVSSIGNVSVESSWIGFNDATGFGVETDGNVTLANSAFFDNADAGAFVTPDGSVNVSNSFFGNCFFGPSVCGDQQVGLIVDGLGIVDISNSQFNQNTSTGLILMTDSDVFLNNVTADRNGFVGAVVLTSGNVKVCGGSYSYNDRFGFTSTAATVFMSEQTLLTGNGDLPMDLGPGTTVVTYDCLPKAKESGDYKLVNVSDGQSVEMDCEEGLAGIELHLPNGDSLIVPCPMRGPASLSGLAFDQLPEGLPDGFTLVSALEAQAARDGLTVSFMMPSPDVQYTILRWNDSSWVELDGATTVDGMFAVVPVSPGIYVLALK